MALEQAFPALATGTLGRSQVIASPFQYLLTGEDRLRIASWGAGIPVGLPAPATLRIDGRFLELGAGHVTVFSYDHEASIDRTIRETVLPLGHGFLLNVVVRLAGGSATRGELFVLVDVVRGTGPALRSFAVLLSGYVGAGLSRAWPGSAVEGPTEGPGANRVYVVPTPAAGADWTFAVPTSARWRLQSLRAGLTCSAAVANRFPGLIVNGTLGTDAYYVGSAGLVQAAGSAVNHTYGGGLTTASIPAFNVAHAALPVGLVLSAAHQVRSSTFGLQAADQWDGIAISVEEHLEPTDLLT